MYHTNNMTKRENPITDIPISQTIWALVYFKTCWSLARRWMKKWRLHLGQPTNDCSGSLVPPYQTISQRCKKRTKYHIIRSTLLQVLFLTQENMSNLKKINIACKNCTNIFERFVCSIFVISSLEIRFSARSSSSQKPIHYNFWE